MDDKVEYINPIDVYMAEEKRETEIGEALEREQRVMEAQEEQRLVEEALERRNRLFGPDWVLREESRILGIFAEKRKAMGKTQTDVARKMGTTKTSVSRLESTTRVNKHSPSLNTLVKYVNAFGYRMQIKLIPTDKMP